MSAVHKIINPKPDAALVLSKAVARSAERLHVSRSLLALLRFRGCIPARIN